MTAAILGSAVLGAGASVYGANKAAKTQTRAGERAIGFQREMFGEAKNALSPYMNLGQMSAEDLEELMPYLTSPIGMDQDFLEQTPGYQFAREQGQRGIDAAMGKAGLSGTGAAVKEAGRFNVGLADQTYGAQFDRENTNRTNTYNRLMQAINSGQGAAGALSGVATQTGGSIGNNMTGIGNAQGGAYMNMANAVGGAGQNALSAYMMSQYLNKMPGAGAAPNAGMYGANPAWDTRSIPAGA